MSVVFAAIPAVIYLGAGPAGDRRHDDHRHPGRLHRAAGRAVPAADGAAQRRRLAGQLAGAVRADLRVPRPARRGRRPGRPRRRRPGAGARATSGSRTSTFALPGQRHRAPSPASTSTSPPAPRWRWSARPARARARSPRWSPGCTTPTPGGSRSTAIDLRDLRLADLAAIVGVVSQETYLLHATVRENLRYARPDATDAEIEDAARAAQIHDLIAEPARRLRHRRRLARPPVLRRREAAHRDRPHAAARPAGAGARRGHQRPGHRDRARRPARVRRARPRAAPRSPSPTGSRPCATPTRSSVLDHGRSPSRTGSTVRRATGSRCSTTAGSSSRARTTRSSPTTAATPPSPPELTAPASPRRSRCTGTGSPPAPSRGRRGSCPSAHASSPSVGAQVLDRRLDLAPGRGEVDVDEPVLVTSPPARSPARCARRRAGPGRRRGRTG